MAEKIDVGDAVLTFTGDMTQLDMAFDKVNQAESRIGPAKASVTDLSNSLEGLGTYFGQAGEAGMQAGEDIEEGMHRAAASTREAKGELALLGEETGIRLPRHIRSFVAELPGVGEALTAAFSATAVLMLVQILAEGAEKLANWVSSTFIFTQAMKDSNESVIAANKLLVGYKDQTEAAAKAISDFGKTPLELASENVKKLTDELTKQKQEFYDNEQRMAAYRMGLDGITEDAANKAGAENIKLAQMIKLQEELIIKAQLEQAALTVETTEKNARQAISIEESLAQSKIKIWSALAMYQASITKDAGVEMLKVTQETDEKEYQLKLATLKKERAAQLQAESDYKSIGDQKGAEAQIALVKDTNAKIEALNADHYAKETAAYQHFVATAKQISDEIMNLKVTAAGSLLPVSEMVDQSFQRLEQAAQQLGVTLHGSLQEAFQQSVKSLKEMSQAYQRGDVSLKEYREGQLAEIKTEIAWQESLGKDVTALKKEADELQALITPIQKVNQVWDGFAAEFAKKSKNVGDEARAMGTMMGQAASQMDQAFASAIMGALQSGESIGKALEKATASVLENLATQALAHAMYCVAMGTAELALGVTSASAAEWFTAAAEFGAVAGASGAAGIALSGGGQGNSGAGQTTAPLGGGGGMSSGGSSAANITNVQRFAAGGLITGPTLAMIGEDANKPHEAILPLDDDRAMGKISDAIGGTSGGDTHVHVKGMVSPDNLKKVVRQINGLVKGRKVNAYSTNTYRTQRRST